MNNYIPLENERKRGISFMHSASKNKRMRKYQSFGGDERILPRIKELIKIQLSLSASEFVDEDQLLTDLQTEYPEYKRKKKGVLKAVIKNAIELFVEETDSGDDSGESSVGDIEFMPDDQETKISNKSSVNRSKERLQGKETDIGHREHVQNGGKDSKIFSSESVKDKNLTPLKNSTHASKNEEAKISKKSSVNRRSKERLQGKDTDIAHREHVQNGGNGSKIFSSESVKDKNSTPLKNSTHSSKNEDSEARSKKKPFSMRKQESKAPVPQHPTVTFSDVGGQDTNLELICKRLVQYKVPQICLSGKPGCGILFHGPPGCGKTLFARAIAGEMKYPLIEVAGTELISGTPGDTAEKIRSLFEQAVNTSPCVLFIDRIDAIATKIESASKEMEKRIASQQLLKSMDDLRTAHADSKVLVIGSTNMPDSLDPGFRRGGRFDLEIAIGFPDEADRISILQVICRDLQLQPDFNFQWLARSTPGYVGADLAAVVSGAVEESYNRKLQKLSLLLESDSRLKSKMQSFMEEPGWRQNRKAAKIRAILSVLRSDAESEKLAEKLTEEMHISVEDFQMALNAYVPCAKREGFASVPSVTWSDVGALKDVQEELQRMIVWPLQYKDLYEKLGISSCSSGVLLWGPKGCGKTLLAKAVANESGINFLFVKGPEFLNMFVGESERSVRRVFQWAKDSAPCVIIFDELDALCPPRSNSSGNAAADRVANTLIGEMDRVGQKQIFVMGTTNRIEDIDSAMLRPGRIEERIFVGLPTAEDRLDILKALTKDGSQPKFGADVDLGTIARARQCDGFSGADLASLLRNASEAAIKDYITNMESGEISVFPGHVALALSKTRPSVSKEERDYFLKMKCYEERC